MSLKDNAQAVLERNRTHNQSATGSKNSMQHGGVNSPLKVAQDIERWNPELASEGYVWCQDCRLFNGFNCNSNDNPFKTVEKQPAVPRKCQWFSDLNNEITIKKPGNGI